MNVDNTSMTVLSMNMKNVTKNENKIQLRAWSIYYTTMRRF
jgi:hypothetical protein